MNYKLSYSKLKVLFSKVPAVAMTIFLLSSCNGGNGKDMAKGSENPAETYKDYLSEIRQQDNLSFENLAEQLKQWQVLKDSVFIHLQRDTTEPPHSNRHDECERLHDSISIEFSRLALSKPRTYQEVLALKRHLTPYTQNKDLQRTAEQLRPFFSSLDSQQAYKGDLQQVVSTYRDVMHETINSGIHNQDALKLYIKKEDSVFRAFLTHLYHLDSTDMADITRDTERCCALVFLAAERNEITHQEASACLAMRTNRRVIQNTQACLDDLRQGKVKTPAQAHAYIWMLIQPYTSLDNVCMALLSSQERKQLDRIAAQTPAAFDTLSRILQTEGGRPEDLPGMLMEIFIHTL